MSVVRDPRFSMTMPESDLPKSTHYRRRSFGKQLERRFITIWKLVTRSTRRQPRNSYISPDFIVITARRKSTMLPNFYRFQK